MCPHKHTGSNSPSLLLLQTSPESEYLPEGTKQLLGSMEAPGSSPARHAGASLSWFEAQCPFRPLHPHAHSSLFLALSSPSRVCSGCFAVFVCSFLGLSFKCTPFSDFSSLESDPVCTLIPMLAPLAFGVLTPACFLSCSSLYSFLSLRVYRLLFYPIALAALTANLRKISRARRLKKCLEGFQNLESEIVLGSQEASALLESWHFEGSVPMPLAWPLTVSFSCPKNPENAGENPGRGGRNAPEMGTLRSWSQPVTGVQCSLDRLRHCLSFRLSIIKGQHGHRIPFWT